MRRAGAGALAAVVVVAASLAGGAAAKNYKGTTYVDKSGGYRITVPTAWKLVPRTKAGIKATIADLKKKKQTALADTYSTILADTSAAELSAYEFQAFAWPVDSATPILTQVSVGIVTTSHTFTAKDMTAIGDTYANQLAANKGSKITVPKEVKLPAGEAEYIIGTIPAGTGLANGVELYLIPHGKKLYELSFQIDASLLSQATLFTSIAQHFAFS
jgi:hypothetical protein